MGPVAKANRTKARRQIIAAAAATLEVLDIRARYISETDDRPRAWLERFARGERASGYPSGIGDHDPKLGALLHRIADARADVWEHPTHAETQADCLVRALMAILVTDCGEDIPAAVAGVRVIYAKHLGRMEREAMELAVLAACVDERARAAADKHAAELALGTAGEGT